MSLSSYLRPFTFTVALSTTDVLTALLLNFTQELGTTNIFRHVFSRDSFCDLGLHTMGKAPYKAFKYNIDF